MKTIGNLLWFFFTGLETAIMWFFLGIAWCITLIGIPFGKQAFKMAKLIIAPFGKTVETHFGSHPILNILWMLWGGLESCICFYWIGILYCITIIGIPFGKQWFKMAKLVFKPFGKSVVFDRKRPVLNFLFFLLGGEVFSLLYFVLGLALCITLVGIPFGKQCLKLAKLSFKPFGRAVA